jgi:hypothetical protein
LPPPAVVGRRAEGGVVEIERRARGQHDGHARRHPRGRRAQQREPLQGAQRGQRGPGARARRA